MKFFRNMKLRYKMILIYSLIAFVPLVIVDTFAMQRIGHLVNEQEKSTSKNMIEVAKNALDGDIKVYNNLSNYLAYSDTVGNLLTYQFDSEYDLYKALTTSFDPLLTSVSNFHTDISSITVYSQKNISHSTTLMPLSKIQNESWYNQVKKSNDPLWIVHGKNVLNVRKMPILERKGQLGIIAITINYDDVFKSFTNLKNKNYGIYIADAKGNVIYNHQNFEHGYYKDMLSYKQCVALSKKKDGHVLTKTSEETGWTLYYYNSFTSMSDNTVQKTTQFMIVVVFISSLLMAFAIWATSRGIVARLEALQDNVKAVEEGALEVTVTSEDQDEIGSLIRGFGEMINRIKFLIEEVYESKIKEKNFEMRALQQQINPHFLYNTLSMINFMAIESGQNDISKITLSLSDFYRTALNKGNNTCSLDDELKNMKAYLDIQQMMHDYDFELDIEIDEEIRGYESPNLILQPIVENAIGHGIDLLEDRKGVLKVYATENEDQVFIMVEDNGVGMDEETKHRMLNENSKGYGMRNVNQRIKLLYGEEYGLHIESVIGEGTLVTIRLPKKVFKNRNI